MRPIVTLDIDGVLADTGYVPKAQHNSYKPYVDAKVFPGAHALVDYLYGWGFEPWFLSSRNFIGAEALTKAWIHKHFGWNYHTRVIIGTAHDTIPKHVIANQLGSVLHIDDDWRVFIERVGAYCYSQDRILNNKWESVYMQRKFNATCLWINNWKDKSSIPQEMENFIDNKKLYTTPTLKEALEIVQTITPVLLGSANRK